MPIFRYMYNISVTFLYITITPALLTCLLYYVYFPAPVLLSIRISQCLIISKCLLLLLLLYGLLTLH